MRAIVLGLLLAANPVAAQQGYWAERDSVFLGYVGENPRVPGLLVALNQWGFVVPLKWDLAQGIGPEDLEGCAFGDAPSAGIIQGSACPAQLVMDVWTDGNEATYYPKRILALGTPGEVVTFEQL